ncbi:nuclease-related domain-containing protein [Angustibacter sp. Root456]|uniref:nuclease-related domain-containing protein n=1 Tax=Angustibacter sp. Root456 TaxID=1736539 RepID=UPI0012F93EB2|nr:nuclease-related domain-containing protein [Angustibacter sp. Root456]
MLVAASLTVLAGFYAAMAWYPGDQAWICGFLAGAFAMMVFAVRQYPPGVVERWQEGAWGEEFTAKELARLSPSAWSVINDVGNGDFNFDHVVVADHGIYCLNSKKSGCDIVVDTATGGIRMTNRYDPSHSWWDRSLLAQARRDAATLSDLVFRRSGQRVWVEPVIVWWGGFAQKGCTARGVGVVHGPELTDRLEHVAKVHHGRPVDRAAVVAALSPGRRRAAGANR